MKRLGALTIGLSTCLAVASAGEADRIATLCQQLGEGQYGSQKACEELIAIGDAAMPGLLKALKDKRPQARWWAVAAVCRIGTDAGFDAAVDVLRNDSNDFVRSTAVYYLRHFRKKGKDVWPVVEAALKDKSGEVARWALRLMVEDNYPQIDGALESILNLGAPDLQSYALTHIREMAERDKKRAATFLPAVRRLLKAKATRLRYDAVYCTVALMDTGQMEFLRATYESAASPAEQEAAIRCVTILPQPPVEAVELFIMGLRSDDEKVRDAAATILRKGCKQYFGYDAKQPLPIREAAVEKWEKWYLQNRAKLQWHPDLRKFLLPGQREAKPATADKP